MCSKQIMLLITALLTLQLSACYPVKEADETKEILEFFKDLDGVYLDLYKKLSNALIDFLSSCIGAVPTADRGATTAILITNKNELLWARDSGDSDKLQAAIEGFNRMQQYLKQSFEKGEKEDELIETQFENVIRLVTQVAEAGAAADQKMKDLDAKLRQQFSQEGIKRHQVLFELLDEFQTSADRARGTQLLSKLEEQRQKYQSIQVNVTNII